MSRGKFSYKFAGWHCAAIAEHIRATTFDNTEITNMTCYFKSGPNNAIFLLFISSVRVAPKFQDAFGYIHSLHTFTGRHSPNIICPDFFGLVDTTLREAAQHTLQGRCALCDISNEDDKDCRAYAVAYKMLATYSAADRSRILEDLRYVSVPELGQEQLEQAKEQNQTEEIVNVSSKASALFAMLDTLGHGKLPRIELWAGLLDFGYASDEIALILDIAGPSSPIEHAIEDLKEFAEVSHECLGTDEQVGDEREYLPDFDDEEDVGEAGSSSLQGQSPQHGLQVNRTSGVPLQVKTDTHELNERSFESQVSCCRAISSG